MLQSGELDLVEFGFLVRVLMQDNAGFGARLAFALAAERGEAGAFRPVVERLMSAASAIAADELSERQRGPGAAFRRKPGPRGQPWSGLGQTVLQASWQQVPKEIRHSHAGCACAY